MDADILLILLQDGVVNGAIYALLALSLVLVFAVTRVVLIPQGEFVAYGALTYAALDEGRRPGSVWLLLAGKPSDQVPRFQMMAAMSRAKIMA